MVKQRKVKPIGKVRDLIRETSQVPTTEEKPTYKVREVFQRESIKEEKDVVK